jgi:hypothetical protein
MRKREEPGGAFFLCYPFELLPSAPPAVRNQIPLYHVIMNLGLIRFCAESAALSLYTAAASEELIINGGFEERAGSIARPRPIGWAVLPHYTYPFWKQSFGGSYLLYPRDYDNGEGVYVSFNPHQGAAAVNVDGMSLYQIVDVIPSREYLLTFQVGSYDNGAPYQGYHNMGGLDLAVFDGDNLASSLAPVFDGSHVLPPGVNVAWNRYFNPTPGEHQVNWQEFNYHFVPSGSQVALVFQGGAYSFSSYTGLDSVSMVLIPEPRPALLTVASLVILAFHFALRRGRQGTAAVRAEELRPIHSKQLSKC